MLYRVICGCLSAAISANYPLQHPQIRILPPAFAEMMLLMLLMLAAWHSGRMPICDQRTFPVPRSTYSWRVTTYVGKPSAIGQPTRPMQPFIRSGSINWVVTNFIGCVLVAATGQLGARLTHHMWRVDLLVIHSVWRVDHTGVMSWLLVGRVLGYS